MPNLLNTGTKDIPLKFAAQLTNIVNQEWKQGSFIDKVSPVTQELLEYWFKPAFYDVRDINFHDGQRQAILNTIYCHEILKSDSILSMYQQISENLLSQDFQNYICEDKYMHPKYCIKMATGTGKTFVLHALLIWQYLNAKNNNTQFGVKYTKNFLLVAPGLIVYERLLDAFLGKEQEDGTRDFETSDLKRNANLFIPEKYRQTVFSFIQNSVAKKEEIGKKITGEGLIAITNWHLLSGTDENEANLDELSSNPKDIIKDLLPITPGLTAGHDLNTIDNKHSNGEIMEYLKALHDICVFNDEAHHIHENKSEGIVTEVEWQKSLNCISENKATEFIQIDFSATPYDVTGSGQNRTKHYFPHIVVNFDLKLAIKSSLVKTVAIDRRKEISSIKNEDLDFKAIRNDKNVIGLSDGQRIMLRAGLEKLMILEKEFTKFDKTKYPKMLVMCEDTKVSPFVCDFLLEQEGLSKDDIMQIDSDKQGSVTQEEWSKIKQRLFNVDKHKSPKIIVSVLMLREGFDVNNICVIVPLRSSQAPILLEQTLGRGLRLMWRGDKNYDDIRKENIKFFSEHKQPGNYIDILSVVEHPAFLKFYDDLINDGIAIEEKEMPEHILGDIIEVKLKKNYKDFDMFIPRIIRDKEETLSFEELNTQDLEIFPWKFEQLKAMVKKGDECFYSEEMTEKVHFGEYGVSYNLFTAKSYNEYLQKMLQAIVNNMTRAEGHSSFPSMQVNQANLMQAIDKYIRNQLFGKTFDPFEDNNWKVLMVAEVKIQEHIMKQLSKIIYEMQNNIEVEDAVIEKEYFSQVSSIRMRENFSLDIKKSIYERTQYPSNKGYFEKDFLLFADRDGGVERIIKISENYHLFARLRYIRTDGLIASYYPDFILKIGDEIFLVETKSDKDKDEPNVKEKQKSALDYCKKVNELPIDSRMSSTWSYSILDDKTFYSMKESASTKDLLDYCKVTNQMINGTLF